MRKEAIYDPVTKDWGMYLDHEFIGSRATEAAALDELDRQAFNLLTHQPGVSLAKEPSYGLHDYPAGRAPA